MTGHKLVIDSNVYYTFIRESSYHEEYISCLSFLHNILEFCENKICINEFIREEFKKFKKIAEKSKCNIYFQPWLKEMHKRSKFKTIHPYPHINPEIHRKDKKYFQTAYNTNDKIVVTCEVKHLERKNEIFNEFGIKILKIKEANNLIIRNHNSTNS